jgi:hypothetical protein
MGAWGVGLGVGGGGSSTATTLGGAIVGFGVGVARALALLDCGEELFAAGGREEFDELTGALDDDTGVVVSD